MAVDMFLKIDDIKGESQDRAHKEEIEVVSWHWGMSQVGLSHSDSGSGAGKVNVQYLTVVKPMDRSSPLLIKLCCDGKHFSNARFTVRKAGEHPLEYLKLELSDGIVASVSYGGGHGEQLTENITLNFASFKCEYTPQSKDGKAMGIVSAQWNIARNSESSEAAQVHRMHRHNRRVVFGEARSPGRVHSR